MHFKIWVVDSFFFLICSIFLYGDDGILRNTQDFILGLIIIEPVHDKTKKWSVHPKKTPNSLGIRAVLHIHAVWSQSSLCALWV